MDSRTQSAPSSQWLGYLMTPFQDNPIPLFVRLLGGKLGSALRSGAVIHLPDQRLINERPKHPGTTHRNRLSHPQRRHPNQR
jgi:hypothetical protein